MSASLSVQLLETEPSPMVLGCGTVCHQTLLLDGYKLSDECEICIQK